MLPGFLYGSLSSLNNALFTGGSLLCVVSNLSSTIHLSLAGECATKFVCFSALSKVRDDTFQFSLGEYNSDVIVSLAFCGVPITMPSSLLLTDCLHIIIILSKQYFQN